MSKLIKYAERLNFSRQNDNILIYNHIPKCGGLSLSHMLRQCFESYCDVHQNILDPFAVPFTAPTDRQLYYGHGVNNIEHYLPTDKAHAKITFLRHPWALAKSLIRFNRWLLPFDPEAQQDPEKILDSLPPNLLIYYLGNGNKEQAYINLFENYVFFGLQEHFSNSLALLCEILPDIADKQQIAKNVSIKSPLNISDKARVKFFAKNIDDLALYQKAKQEFERRCLLYGVQSPLKIQDKPQSKQHLQTNTQGDNINTVLALKKTIALHEDLPGMVDNNARFENWLHIILHSMQSKEELSLFFQWLMDRTDKRHSCIYFAFCCAKKAKLLELPIVAKHLFNLCQLRDPDNNLRLLIEWRLDVIRTWIEFGINKNITLSANAKIEEKFIDDMMLWLSKLAEKHTWRKQALSLYITLAAR